MKISQGSHVAVHYRGTLENGEEFDSSEGREPLEFVVGGGQLIPGFEAALLGLEAGQEKTFTLKPDEAYGLYDRDVVIEGPRKAFPDGAKAGQSYTFEIGKGQEAEGRIVETTDAKVVVDFNHPLAGKSLTFRVRVVSVA